MASIIIFSLLSLLSFTRAQDRAPHGLAYQNPMPISPSAFNFFHRHTKQPTSRQETCAATNCSSPKPQAAKVASTLERETKSMPEAGGRSRVGAGAIAGVVLGFVCVAGLLAVAVYYKVVTRRPNPNPADSVPPHTLDI